MRAVPPQAPVCGRVCFESFGAGAAAGCRCQTCGRVRFGACAAGCRCRCVALLVPLQGAAAGRVALRGVAVCALGLRCWRRRCQMCCALSLGAGAAAGAAMYVAVCALELGLLPLGAL